MHTNQPTIIRTN